MAKPKPKDLEVSPPSDDLFPEHLDELTKGSGITRPLIEARGYKTITTRTILQQFGYTRSQGGEGPWLFIPTFDPASRMRSHGYQVKPTMPRVDKRGKPVKYEIPAKSMPTLDVHPLLWDKVQDPSQRLIITEGIKKGDSIASHGIPAVSLSGVWGWKAGSLPQEGWEAIPLKDREVVLVFDSDASDNTKVWDALSALMEFLKRRGAKPLNVQLPALKDLSKTGLDDYLVHTQDGHKKIWAYATEALPPRPKIQDGEDVLCFVQYTPEGLQPTPIANFNCWITGEILLDDGIEIKRELEITAKVRGREIITTVTPDEFHEMKWIIPRLGSDAVLMAIPDARSRAREAIQTQSIGKPARHVYRHIGWRKIQVRPDLDPEWVYLFPGGAIGSGGAYPNIEVNLPVDGSSYIHLPPPPTTQKEIKAAIRSSMLLVDEENGVVPLTHYFAIWRAVLGNTLFGMWSVGKTGVGKSEIAALIQQHWGAELTPQRFLGNWNSTENYLAELAYYMKDFVLVVDDFKPGDHYKDRNRLNAMADRLFRGQGNAQGRGRMGRGLDLLQGKPVRAMLYATGEDIPEGESLLARMLVAEIEADDSRFEKLDQHQANAAKGRLAECMSLFLQWMAPQYDAIQKRVREDIVEYRKKFLGSHRRTKEAGASVAVAAMVFMDFLVDHDVLSPSMREALENRLIEEINKEAYRQAEVQVGSGLIAEIQELFGTALLQGKARIDYLEGYELQPTADWVGWIGRGALYLHPSAFLTVVKEAGRRMGTNIHWTEYRVGKALLEEGLIHEDMMQNGRLKVSRRHNNKSIRVWPVKEGFIHGAERMVEWEDVPGMDHRAESDDTGETE